MKITEFHAGGSKGRIPHFIFGILAVALGGALFMTLWNRVVTEIATVPTLNFWISSGMVLLMKFLFRGNIHSRVSKPRHTRNI